ncbi:AI-2E family transporter [Microbacterium thalli]|uniref:AI-2E family transporter n=1 Tax=Microbacterium thalli TaxID=3027921 RepID=UPI0023669B50|nr:AI-2E family transporter [Microbacterium thalli]MDD7928604.1 AI-2E family transporter [Microbacterium thalli]
MRHKSVPQTDPVPGVTPAAPAGLTPMLRILVGLAAAVIVLAGLYAAREIAGPLLLGAVIVIICHPVRRPLERRGWPRWAATTAVIAVAYLILAALAAMLAYAGVQFTRLVTDSAPQLRATADAVLDWLQAIGFEQQVADAAASVLQPGTLASFATSLGSSVLSVLTAFFFVLAYVIFMAADGARYTRAEATFGERARPTMQRFRSFNHGVRTYYVVNASFGAVVAIIDGLALWALQVPAPVVWAVLAFVTNFVPNIGFILGLVPPALLALVVGGWPLMLIVIAIYCVVNVTLQVMIQPKFVSDAVDLSLTLSFFSVIFWTFVIGPLGAILSIPLTLLVRALVLESDPGAGWMRWLSGDRQAVPRFAEPEPDPLPVAPGQAGGRRRVFGFSPIVRSSTTRSDRAR